MNNNYTEADVVALSDLECVDSQAARWVARLDNGQPSPQTLADFKFWINQSPAHKRAFESYVELWDGMNIATELVPPRHQRSSWAGFTQPRRRVAWALASVLLLAVFTLQLLPSSDPVYRTAVGEQRLVSLPDGSTVFLNTDTRIVVGYRQGRREIHLQRGEALFDVAHKPDRPFEVYAGKGMVRAVGTVFSVYLRPSDVEVVVTDGAVEIGAAPLELDNESEQEAPASELSMMPPRVKAGHIATFDRHTAQHIEQAELQKSANKTAWHHGLLLFEDESLQLVIEQMGRYTSERFIIPEQSLRDFKVSGQFRVGDTDAMLEALRISFNIQSQGIDDGIIYLVRKDNVAI